MMRVATILDIDEIVAVENNSFDSEHYHLNTKVQFRHLLTKGNAEILVIEENQKICGTATILYKKNSNYGRFYSLAVLPEKQGSGFGKELFEETEKHIKAKGLKGVLCEVREDNIKLFERYLKIGYNKVRIVPDYYPDGVGCIKMKKVFA